MGRPADGVSGGGLSLPEATPGVEEVLVDRVAVGAERYRHDVDRDLVESDRDEHLALAVSELADRVRQRVKLRALLEPILGPGGQRISPLVPEVPVAGRWLFAPSVARDLGRDLEDHELVRPGGEPAQAAEVIEPGQNIDDCVIGGLLREIVELRAGDRSQLVAPS